MKIGVTGPNGNLGSKLVEMGCDALNCDITDPSSILDAIAQVRPDIIINTAAKSNVDWCEEHEVEALKVNLRGVYNLLEVYKRPVIHLSTSYVFDGKSGPYPEKGYTWRKSFPVQSYGWSKLGGETVLLTSERPGDCIVRTVGLFGGIKEDFVSLVHRTLVAGKSLDVARDIKFNPTYIPHLAEALIKLCEMKDRPSILNIAGDTVYSRYSFALLVASVFELDATLINPVDGCSSWKAVRPKNAGLKVDLAISLGLPIRSPIDGLEAMVEYA